MSEIKHWAGFDFDGTLVEYPKSGQRYGKDNEKVIGIFKYFMDHGITVKVVTARAAYPEMRQVIQSWLDAHGWGHIEITDKKDYGMLVLFDDLAITIDSKSGEIATDMGVANNILARLNITLAAREESHEPVN